jgi:hypothetical protein
MLVIQSRSNESPAFFYVCSTVSAGEEKVKYTFFLWGIGRGYRFVAHRQFSALRRCPALTTVSFSEEILGLVKGYKEVRK